MSPRILENNKRLGLCYALTDDGVELPVIDITHPAFALALDLNEWRARLEKHLQLMKRRERMPGFVRSLVFGVYRRNSVLLRGLLEAKGTFLSGMNTYLLKLGPENLGRGYAGRCDRKVAASFPAQAARFRLQETAQRIARGLAPALAARSGALHLINIAGGPGTDSLNALLLLRRERPEWLAHRRTHIHILDLHREAPNFGRRALAALQKPGSPLHGLEIQLEHIVYDWADPAPLRKLLLGFEQDALVAGSSEGGLFQYGSDGEIAANLEVLWEGSPQDFTMTGSVTWEGPLVRWSRNFSGLAVRAFKPEAFHRLVRSAGWDIEQGAGETTRQVVSLRKRL
jgi:hypothetical protein